MNKKGFTLTELLATLVVLGIIMGITIISTTGGFKKAKKDTEEVFIGTIEDALDMYLDSDAKSLEFPDNDNDYACTMSKTHGKIKVYKANNNLTFNNIINSKYSPLTESELVNPANEKEKCNSNVNVSIYRDEDYVYYYALSREDFGCLLNKEGYITNFPGDSECLS